MEAAGQLRGGSGKAPRHHGEAMGLLQGGVGRQREGVGVSWCGSEWRCDTFSRSGMRRH